MHSKGRLTLVTGASPLWQHGGVTIDEEFYRDLRSLDLAAFGRKDKIPRRPDTTTSTVKVPAVFTASQMYEGQTLVATRAYLPSSLMARSKGKAGQPCSSHFPAGYLTLAATDLQTLQP